MRASIGIWPLSVKQAASFVLSGGASELDKLLENAPSPVIAQHAARISSIRKRVLALNMLLRAIQRRIDNIDRMVSTGVTSDHPSRAQLQNHN